MKQIMTILTVMIFVLLFLNSCGGSSAKKGSLKDASIRNDETFKENSGTFTDKRDSQIYKWIRLGNQIWMAQNLNYTTNDSWCYDDNSSNSTTYGRLYTWEEAKVVCPTGWHLPDTIEWKILIDFSGGIKIAGDKLKSTDGWKSPNNGTNISGFTALPGGSRYPTGNFRYVGESAIMWSSTDNQKDSYCACAFVLSYRSDEGKFYTSTYKSSGLSVRCLKD